MPSSAEKNPLNALSRDAARAAAVAEIEAVVRRFEGADRVGEPVEYLIGVGTK